MNWRKMVWGEMWLGWMYRPRRRPLLCGSILLLFVLIISACQSSLSPTRETDYSRPTITEVAVTAPESIPVGSTVTITVTSQPPSDGQAIQLFLFNTNGTTLLTGSTSDGTATFRLDDSVTRIAGQVELVAQIGAARAAANLTIVPGKAIEPVLALVGPRSITADRKHWTMLTALPNDRFGNAVADGTMVTVRTLHPATEASQLSAMADAIEVLTTETEHLLAWARIYVRTKAGRMDMAANAGEAHSPERTVLAVPGPPIPFGLIAEPAQRNADGRQLITVLTEPLQDQFSNLLLDGTAVTFLLTNPDGTTRMLPAQSIDGKATVQVQAPAMAGPLQIRAVVFNTTSRPLTLDFDAGIGVGPITLRAIPTAELLTLIAGPLLGSLGQYIPDGSDVVFTLEAEGNSQTVVEVTAPASAGFATAVIRTSTLAAGRYTAQVAAGVGNGVTTIELP